MAASALERALRGDGAGGGNGVDAAGDVRGGSAGGRPSELAHCRAGLERAPSRQADDRRPVPMRLVHCDGAAPRLLCFHTGRVAIDGLERGNC
eukprot:355947-Chlamydomonas_euryale.AAC.4